MICEHATVQRSLAFSAISKRQEWSHHETADAYLSIVAQFCARHRVIVCKDDFQWILQQRKKGGAERPWRGVGYFRSSEALIRTSATLCGQIDPCALAILATLPKHFGDMT